MKFEPNNGGGILVVAEDPNNGGWEADDVEEQNSGGWEADDVEDPNSGGWEADDVEDPNSGCLNPKGWDKGWDGFRNKLVLFHDGILLPDVPKV